MHSHYANLQVEARLSRLNRADYDQLKQRGLQCHTAPPCPRLQVASYHGLLTLEKRNPMLHATALKIILPREKKAE